MSLATMVTAPIRKIFGSRNDRLIKRYRQRVEQINALEPQVRRLTDAQLRERVAEIRAQIAEKKLRPDEALYEAFAIMRESLDRNVGIRNIFNPDHREVFQFDKLPASAQKLYQQVESEIAERSPTTPLGAAEAVPPFMDVDLPVELYDAVREVYTESRPPFRCRPFDVQLIGGMVLYEGSIAEMKTGEGKTIVAPLACFMASLAGMQCHVVTVNDYLVQRDRDWVFPAFHRLGLTVGAIHPIHEQHPRKKAEAYHCDVVYGTNSEFGFDYLRDNMKLSTAEQLQKRRDFCIVDEIDSILIDEARTPLIISGPAHDDAPQYVKANQVAEQLVARQQSVNRQSKDRITRDGFADEAARQNRVPTAQIEKIIAKFIDLGPDFLDEKEADFISHPQHYVVKRENKQASMTHLGVEEAQKIVGTRFYVVGNDMAWDHLINNALRAHTVYQLDREYVVEDLGEGPEVIIVDENTGRKMIGRQWSDGLHQAVEAKESSRGVKIKQETQTLATITIQNFFKLYKRLAGMTGTAVTEATEFHEIYHLDVVVIPTNVPVVRADEEDLIFIGETAKWHAIVEEIRRLAVEEGRPVLVGTTSVEKSEVLSAMLTRTTGLEHEVLNAKQHAREASIVAKAGQLNKNRKGDWVGNITIATNMAGRGTDIKLSPKVREHGGLAIIGTERHESRRIDNQLRGRAGRQGDPGSSRFFISMEDDLMKLFAGKTTMRALSMLGMKEDDAIEHRWITKSVERAQRKVEERNFQIRKSLLEWDEVPEFQRTSFYGTRQMVLEGEAIKELIFDYIAESIEDAVGKYLDEDFVPMQVAEASRDLLNVSIEPGKLRGGDLSEVERTIRSEARAEATQDIERNVGEYMTDETDPDSYDLKGLGDWAMRQFSVKLSQGRLREMSPRDVMDELTAHAHELIDRKPLDALAKFFEPGYAASELAAWARQKFGLELVPDELKRGERESMRDAQQRVAELVYSRAEEAYRRREIEYPVEFVLEMAFGTAQQGADASAWAADQIVQFANQRYDLGWTVRDVTAMTGEQLHNALVDAAERWNNGALGQWLDKATFGEPDDATLAARFGERWRNTKSIEQIDDETQRQRAEEAVTRWRDELAEELAAAEDREALLRDRAQMALRRELTQLEQYVLLQILDQAWKDHLYAMDQMKDAIRLQGYAEKDPKIMFKTEGARMFREMLASVREKVTELIFKARLTADVQIRNRYENQTASHDVAESTGVGGTAEQRADLAAADRAGGGERQVVQTIVNKDPQVGRNDPCPCGSGKKYKKCCGKAR